MKRSVAVALTAGLLVVGVPVAGADAASASRVTAGLSAPATTVRAADYVIGSVTGGARTVDLQRLGRTWTTVKAVTSDRYGHYRIPVSTAAAGTFLYRVYVPARRAYTPVSSGVLRLTVRNASIVSAAVGRDRDDGYPNAIIGSVSGGSRPMTLQRLSGAHWVNVGTARSDSMGMSYFPVSRASYGTYTYRILAPTYGYWAGAVSKAVAMNIAVPTQVTGVLSSTTAQPGQVVTLSGVVTSAYPGSRRVQLQSYGSDTVLATTTVTVGGRYTFKVRTGAVGLWSYVVSVPGVTYGMPGAAVQDLTVSVNTLPVSANGPFTLSGDLTSGVVATALNGSHATNVYRWMTGKGVPSGVYGLPVFASTGVAALGGRSLQTSTATGSPHLWMTAPNAGTTYVPVAFTRNGRFLQYTTNVPDPGFPETIVPTAVSVLDLATGKSTVVETGTPSAPAVAGVVSEDGGQFAYQLGDSWSDPTIRVVTAATGATAAADITGLTGPAGLKFTPAGRLTVAGIAVDPATGGYSENTCVFALSTAPGVKPSQLFCEHDGNLGNSLDFSPDGTKMLWVDDPGNDVTAAIGTVWLADADGTNSRALTRVTLPPRARLNNAEFVGPNYVAVGVISEGPGSNPVPVANLLDLGGRKLAEIPGAPPMWISSLS
ncbi:hypothetical protein [Terrabacter sp. BE26]|uniref:hypothetical protein n=1 Tax=Terrabacter sp. BE26 TaxID=2898152 RepID=UPI0035BE3A42